MQNWLKQAVVYQIYPRSFFDGNNDGVGDLVGVIKKLDYLVELGINTIWFSPFYPSPMADFGYDVKDFKDIDPIFGSLADFEKLIIECKKRSIKVILDFIPNHSSDQHPWFLDSRSSKKSLKRNFYIWADPKSNGEPPNNWLSCFGGSAWEFDAKTGQYYLHSFAKEQPDLNWRNPEVEKEMLDTLRFWLDKGVDGFRADAVYWMMKDEKLRDEPLNPGYILGANDPYQQLVHFYTFGQKETLPIIKRFMDVLEEYKDKFLVTEAYISIEEMVKFYQEVKSPYYAPFNFNFILQPFKAYLHRQYIDIYDKVVGARYMPTYVLGNHDQPRIVSRIGQRLARLAIMLLLTLRGVPFIYYGEEIGMEDGQIPLEFVQDPAEKNLPGLGLGRDPERTPMQWDDSLHAGFSQKAPWLPIAENYVDINVKKEMEDASSMLSLYKKLIFLRTNENALIHGTYESLDLDDPNMFAFTRTFESERMLIVLNYSPGEKKIQLPFQKGTVCCNTALDKKEGEEVNLSELTIKGEEGLLIKF